jgi:hypothetical protein
LSSRGAQRGRRPRCQHKQIQSLPLAARG